MKKIFIAIVIIISCFVARFYYLELNKKPIVVENEQSKEPEKFDPFKGEAAQNSSQVVNPGDPMVSINFDDGWESDYIKAVPILEGAGMKATFYIITQKHSGVYNMEGDYMDDKQVQELYSKGFEIGGHTRNHPALTIISSESRINEIAGCKKDLLDLGIITQTFAYPYGKTNSSIKKVVREAGFMGARTTSTGFNSADTNRYSLHSLDVKYDATFSLVKEYIDKAVKNKQWLILTFHRIDENQDPVSSTQSINHEFFQQIVTYLKDNNIAVVTNAQALQLLK